MNNIAKPEVFNLFRALSRAYLRNQIGTNCATAIMLSNPRQVLLFARAREPKAWLKSEEIQHALTALQDPGGLTDVPDTRFDDQCRFWLSMAGFCQEAAA